MKNWGFGVNAKAYSINSSMFASQNAIFIYWPDKQGNVTEEYHLGRVEDKVNKFYFIFWFNWNQNDILKVV